MSESIFIKLGMFIMAPEPISTAYLTNPSYQSVSLYVYPFIVARQLLGTKFTAVTNKYATTEELLDPCGIRESR
jgi:hypothetical protein